MTSISIEHDQLPVPVRTEGDFPVAELRHCFALDGDLIAEPSIAA